MKKRRNKNISLPNQMFYGVWFEQKKSNGLHYNMVFQKFDDLTSKGFNCFQIEQILELGEQAYKDGKII